MYADDVVFYTCNKNVNVAQNGLQEDATIIYNWFCKTALVYTLETFIMESLNISIRDYNCHKTDVLEY